MNWKNISYISEESHGYLVFSILGEKLMIIIGMQIQVTEWNQFGDLTSDEFHYEVHGHLGSPLKYNYNDKPMKRTSVVSKEERNVKVPTSIYWTDYNGYSYVTPVKNQDSCGSCW